MDNSNITINDLATLVKGGFDELGESMEKSMKAGFDKVDKRFEQIDKRFEQVDERFRQIDKRFEDIYSRLDSIDAKLIFIQKEIEDIKLKLQKLDKRTIEDTDILSTDNLELSRRVKILEEKVEQLSHA